MVSEEQLKEYIRKQLAAGRSILEIRNSLIKSEWPQNTIDKLLDEVLRVHPQSTHVKKTKFKEGFFSFWWYSVKNTFLHPTTFFESPPEAGYGRLTLFSLINYYLEIIPLVLLIFYVLANIFAIFKTFLPIMTISIIITLFLIIPLGLIAGLFIFSAYTYFFMRLVKGKGTYYSTFAAQSYLSATTILVWVPIINIVIMLYSIYIALVALSKAHKISKLRVFFGMMIPYGILIFLGVVFAFI